MLLAFHKPFGVLSQFSPDNSPNRTLAEFGFPPSVYPVGRLDADSEGLLLLTDETSLNDRLLHPRHEHPRTYWVQVERIPSPTALAQLARGPTIQGRPTRCASVQIIHPTVPPRVPPIRYRKNVPDTWLELELTEGRNRQVRRMTAAIGHPTLRLIRVRIGAFNLDPLPAGTWIRLNPTQRHQVLSQNTASRR